MKETLRPSEKEGRNVFHWAMLCCCRKIAERLVDYEMNRRFDERQVSNRIFREGVFFKKEETTQRARGCIRDETKQAIDQMPVIFKDIQVRNRNNRKFLDGIGRKITKPGLASL